jgi:hypothetical protein
VNLSIGLRRVRFVILGISAAVWMSVMGSDVRADEIEQKTSDLVQPLARKMTEQRRRTGVHLRYFVPLSLCPSVTS